MDTPPLYTRPFTPSYNSFGYCYSVWLPSSTQMYLYTPWPESNQWGKCAVAAATMPAWSPHTEPLKRVWLSPHKAPFPKCSNFSHDMISWGSKQNYSFFLLISPLSKNGLDGYSAKNVKYGFSHSFFGSMPRCFYKLAIFASSQVCNPNFSSHVTKKTCFTVDASECTGNIMVADEGIAISLVEKAFQEMFRKAT